MPVSTSWFIENRVILITEHGAVTAGELVETIDLVNTMVADLPSRVYLILDERAMTSDPGMAAYRRYGYKMPDFAAVLNISPRNHVQRFVTESVAKMLRKKLIFFDDMPSVIDYLYREEPALQNMELEIDTSV